MPSRNRLIGVALGAKTTVEMLDALHQVAAVAAVAELRLDLMDELDLPRLLEHRPCPVIVTYRPEREGGRYAGSEPERVAVLRQAIELGADYVDVELDTVGRIGGRLGERRATGLIVSSHDFDRMPADFVGRWRELRATGADVVKLVGMAHDVRETLPVFAALAQADRPTIAIAMGDAGLPTRVLALQYDACFLTFCTLRGSQGTAPGQLSVADLVDVYRGRQLNAATAVYGLIGPHVDTVDTDRAGEYNRLFRAAGQDAVAVPLVIPEGGDAAETIWAFRALPVRGYQVHPAHAETVGQALDTLDPSACRAGRVNTVYTRNDQLVGAWVDSTPERLGLWTGGASVEKRR